jgi:uncharacterized metal-binding protein (TIGR02443 family)
MMKKRFIAGARCPKCEASDSLRWWEENNIEHVECVECGYVEQRTPQNIQKTAHSDESMIGIFKPE